MMNADEGWRRAVKIWAPLLLGIFGYVVAVDLDAYRHGKEMMTTEFREGLAHPVGGPILWAIWNAIFGGLSFHFMFKATQQRLHKEHASAQLSQVKG